MIKSKIVISAINIRSGGALSILNDALYCLENNFKDKLEVYAIVHNKNLCIKSSSIEYIEIKDSIESYTKRLYYEYFFFKKISKKIKPEIWLSLHDITPKVNAKVLSTYCHNPSPFYKTKFKEILLDPKFFFFNKLYRSLYKINIESNNFIIVQQDWIRKEFKKIYKSGDILVARPNVNIKNISSKIKEIEENKLFFFPSLPRIFKNFEIILEATAILEKKGIKNFKVIITIDGSENKYARYIKQKYSFLQRVDFIGLISREKVFEIYEKADCLIFPSKLETFGLPIIEFKQTGRYMLIADLPYSRETLGDYCNYSFFNPEDKYELADKMESFLSGNPYLQKNKNKPYEYPFSENWISTFDFLIEASKSCK